MYITTIDDFLLARSRPVGPTQSFVNELKLNGKSPEFIRNFIETGNLDNGDSVVELYGNAEGYLFDWGHVLENLGANYFDGEIFLVATWNIVFNEVLHEFHLHGLHLEDLTVACETILSDRENESKLVQKIPQCLQVTGGNEASAFEFICCDSGEDAIRQIHEAREWLAKCFFSETVYELISCIQKKLSRRCEKN